MSDPSVNNAILKLSREHDIVMNYVVRFDQQLARKAYDDLFHTIHGLADFLRRDLSTHFRAEEQVIYPALIAADPSYENIQLVLSLVREHGRLWTLAERIFEEFRFGPPVSGPTQGFVLRVHDFLDAIKAHARVEITDLFPKIAASDAALGHLRAFSAHFAPPEAASAASADAS